MGATLLASPGPLAREAPYALYDDFTAGSQAPFAAGRQPRIGPNAWTISGAGAGHALVGGLGGFTSTTAFDGGNIYALATLASAPAEIGGAFVWTGAAATPPTIALVKDYAATGITVMWHANLTFPAAGQMQFAPGYWLGGQVNAQPAFAQPQFGESGRQVALVVGREYTRRLFVEPPFLFETLEEADGTILGTQVVYEPNLAAVVGPTVFFEGNGQDLSWRRVWARARPAGGLSASLARFRGGIDGTPIGSLVPAFVRGSAVHGGTGTPYGVLSARLTDPADRAGIVAENTPAFFEARAETAGYNAELRLTNFIAGAFRTAKLVFDGGLTTLLQTDGVTWLGKSWLGDLFVPSGFALRLGGTAGPRLLSGAGSPEGAVTAPVGSHYMRTDGGAGSSFYVKESGTGATGWAAK